MSEPQVEEILDLLDPDWRDRWRWDSYLAARHYREFAYKEWMNAKRELSGQPPLPERNSRGETFEEFYERMQNEPRDEEEDSNE
jgi:hypothetical protein